MQHDILHFKEFAAFVNCEVGERAFTCGVAYLAPNLPPALPLYSLDGVLVCTVEISEDYRRHPTSQTITVFNDDLRFPCQTP
jgi:hypothetical protein